MEVSWMFIYLRWKFIVEKLNRHLILTAGLYGIFLVKEVKLPLCFLTEHHAMKAYWGSGCVAPLIL
jgi:hypothetical protein